MINIYYKGIYTIYHGICYKLNYLKASLKELTFKKNNYN